MKRFIEGEDRRQATLLPDILEDYVTEDNPVRVIDVFIDELDLGALGFAGVVPEATGRPAYHPATLLKIYLYGYLNRIQSSRRLERESQRNIELMWLTGRLMPDFKTIADFRRDNGPAILVAEGDAGLIEADEPPVRDGDPMSVAGQIGQHCLGAGKGRLGIDDPALFPGRGQMTQERPPLGEVLHGTEEGEPPSIVQCDQPGEEQATEQLAQHLDGEKEGRPRRHPTSVGRDAAAGNDHVHMGMMRQGRAPGVEDGGDADAGAEVLRVTPC